MKLPAFQFYPGDWRKDPGVQSLDYEARGVWLEILCLMHESERRGVLLLNGRAMPDSALARLLGLDLVLLNQILTTLDNHGVTSRETETGALMSRRMVRDEELRKIRQNCGKKGGNPVLVNQNPTTQLNQKATPSSSSSSSDVERESKAPEVCAETPSLTEIKAYASLNGVKPDTAEAFFRHYEGNNLWLNQHGRPINWKVKLTAWKVADQAKPAQKPAGAQRGPFLSEMKAQLDVKKALRDKIVDRGDYDPGGNRVKACDREEFKRLNREIGELMNQIDQYGKK